MISAVRKIAVIGGGWAGCAAAVELARANCQVTLFERARILGGRARAVELHGRMLDNGQHILLGAYSETLRLMKTVGIAEQRAFLRLPLQMRYAGGDDGMDFFAPRLPAPLHLLVALVRAKGLTRDDKLALARFSTSARWIDWRLHADCTVSELLERFDQTERLVRLMWRPLCIAALNTPPERASAQVFLNVLRDSLGASRRASDMLVPRANLSALFPDGAGAFVTTHGGHVAIGCAVEKIERGDSGWQLGLRREDEEAGFFEFDALIIATPPDRAAELLAGLPGVVHPGDFAYEPITTCYLQYDPSVRLTLPFYALADDAQANAFGQFVFDRGHLDAGQAGLLAVVVSASKPAIALGSRLADALAAQLAKSLAMPMLSQPTWSKIITEKRATFACHPDIKRPPSATGCVGVYLAGDYIACDYPATLEAAVRSGVQAARLAISHLTAA